MFYVTLFLKVCTWLLNVVLIVPIFVIASGGKSLSAFKFCTVKYTF